MLVCGEEGLRGSLGGRWRSGVYIRYLLGGLLGVCVGVLEISWWSLGGLLEVIGPRGCILGVSWGSLGGLLVVSWVSIGRLRPLGLRPRLLVAVSG